MSELAVVGQRVARVDAANKATGAGIFATDVKLTGMLHVKVLRSPLSHAKILHIDASRAQKLLGVRTIMTADDIPEIQSWSPRHSEPPLAWRRVRHVGDPVVAVAASAPDIAEEALELITVVYEELPAVFTMEEALQPEAPAIHEGGNAAYTMSLSRGDVDAAFAAADAIVEGTFSTSIQCQSAMEPHVAVATWGSDGKLTMWSSLTSLFHARKALATALGVAENKVRLIQPYVGGDFGSKTTNPQRLYFQAAFIARQTGRAVRLENTREEDMATTRARMPTKIGMKLGASRDGSFVAKETRVLSDQGAYLTSGPMIMGTTAMRHESIYRFQNVRTQATLVYTNKTPTGAFRGLGNPQGTFPLESLIDELAEKLSLDPKELRLRNASQAGDITVHGWVLHSCGLTECIERSTAAAHWAEQRRARGSWRGVGLGCCIHVSGRKAVGGFTGSSAFVRVNEDGTVNLITGEGEMGQGASTVLTQICAEELGVGVTDINISQPDTDVVPHAANPGASKVTHVGGNAVRAAAADAKRQLLEIAAAELEASVADLEARQGRIYVRGTPAKALSVAQVVHKAQARKGGGPILGKGHWSSDAEGTDPKTFYGNQSSAYAFAAQVAEVKVDPETGEVKVEGFFAAHDLGRAINPTTAEGQVEGGITQGLGYALLEEQIWRDGKASNPNFLDYKIPTAMDAAPVQPILVETIDPKGPFGAKGIGEPVLVPTAPAIANAVYHATGVRIRDLPITPEKLWAGLKARKSPSGESHELSRLGKER